MVNKIVLVNVLILTSPGESDRNKILAFTSHDSNLFNTFFGFKNEEDFNKKVQAVKPFLNLNKSEIVSKIEVVDPVNISSDKQQSDRLDKMLDDNIL